MGNSQSSHMSQEVRDFISSAQSAEPAVQSAASPAQSADPDDAATATSIKAEPGHGSPVHGSLVRSDDLPESPILSAATAELDMKVGAGEDSPVPHPLGRPSVTTTETSSPFRPGRLDLTSATTAPSVEVGAGDESPVSQPLGRSDDPPENIQWLRDKKPLCERCGKKHPPVPPCDPRRVAEDAVKAAAKNKRKRASDSVENAESSSSAARRAPPAKKARVSRLCPRCQGYHSGECRVPRCRRCGIIHMKGACPPQSAATSAASSTAGPTPSNRSQTASQVASFQDQAMRMVFGSGLDAHGVEHVRRLLNRGPPSAAATNAASSSAGPMADTLSQTTGPTVSNWTQNVNRLMSLGLDARGMANLHAIIENGPPTEEAVPPQDSTEAAEGCWE